MHYLGPRYAFRPRRPFFLILRSSRTPYELFYPTLLDAGNQSPMEAPMAHQGQPSCQLQGKQLDGSVSPQETQEKYTVKLWFVSIYSRKETLCSRVLGTFSDLEQAKALCSKGYAEFENLAKKLREEERKICHGYAPTSYRYDWCNVWDPDGQPVYPKPR